MNKKAKSEALRLLNRRGYFSSELKKKLEKKGFTAGEIEEAIRECEKYGYINDKERRERFIENKKKKSYGPKKIAFDLKLKRVEMSEEEQVRIMLEYLKKKQPEKEKAFARLARRGFDFECIYRALEIFQKNCL